MHFERDGVPNVALLSSVSSYSEAEQRQRDNGCDVLLVPAEVMQEMIDSGVGPQIG